jgi:hypothetical protein
MPAEVRLVKLPNGDFRPSLEEDHNNLARVKGGDIITLPFRVERNSKFNRKFWAMVAAVAEHTDEPVNKEIIVARLKKRLHLLQSVYDPIKEEWFVILDSISFAKMTEAEFEQFYKSSTDVLIAEFLPAWQDTDLEEAVRIVLDFT